MCVAKGFKEVHEWWHNPDVTYFTVHGPTFDLVLSRSSVDRLWMAYPRQGSPGTRITLDDFVGQLAVVAETSVVFCCQPGPLNTTVMIGSLPQPAYLLALLGACASSRSATTSATALRWLECVRASAKSLVWMTTLVMRYLSSPRLTDVDAVAALPNPGTGIPCESRVISESLRSILQLVRDTGLVTVCIGRTNVSLHPDANGRHTNLRQLLADYLGAYVVRSPCGSSVVAAGPPIIRSKWLTGLTNRVCLNRRRLLYLADTLDALCDHSDRFRDEALVQRVTFARDCARIMASHCD